MKTWKIFVGLFFSLGLLVFLVAFLSFSGDLLKNRNVFTASLAQDTVAPTATSEVGPPAGGPTSTDSEVLVESNSAFASVEAPADKQDQIDDILEQIDILERQLADLTPIETEKVEAEKDILVEKVEEPVKKEEILVAKVKINSVERISYPNIIISEVQIGGVSDSKEEFVELFNPNDKEVDLSGWYLQRKTKTGANYSSYASSTLFKGSKVSAKGYFLIARREEHISANIYTTNALSEDNSLVLKNPNGEIMDLLGWGEVNNSNAFPAVNPPAGQSIGRKFDVENNIEINSNNNVEDFEIDTPTPLAQNVAYVAPPPEDPIETVIPEPENEPPLKILINRVQTEGITVLDEFVELKNPNEVDLDLTDFALKKKTASGNESNLVSADSFTGIIKADGYFLIAPQDYTGPLIPDLRYSGNSYSIASGNTILLYDAEGILMDEYSTSEVIEPEPEPEPEPQPEPEPPIEVPPVEPPPSEELPPPVVPKVVINEIAWMGTTISVNNEWMELYNPGDAPVDLSGWKLASADGTPSINLSSSIDAHGFYLLERTDDNSVPDVPADKIYTGALGNTGENLSLTDASLNVIDEVNSIPWFAGENATKKTMQRKDAMVSGNDQNNWQSSSQVGGTPRF